MWLWARVIWLEPSSTVIKNLLQRSSRDYGSDWSPTNLLASCCYHVHIGDANTKTIAKCSCSSDTAAMCATNGAEKVIETIDTESIAGMQSSPETSEPFLEEEEELKWNPTTLTSHVIDWINRVRSSRKNEKNFWNQFENTCTHVYIVSPGNGQIGNEFPWAIYWLMHGLWDAARFRYPHHWGTHWYHHPGDDFSS